MAKHEKDFFYSRCNITYARSVSSEWVYATGRQEDEDGETFVSDKRDRAITCVFCRDLLLTLVFSCLLQKDLLKGRWSLAESFFKQNYCQLCHTKLAVFFPLPSCCLSSVIYLPATRKVAQLNRPSVFFIPLSRYMDLEHILPQVVLFVLSLNRRQRFFCCQNRFR